jgi:O-antigen/teichoic acid export membrane protein
MTTAGEPQPPIGELSDYRAHRKRRFLLAVGSSLLVRPLSALFPLIVVPLFLRYLGNEMYGLYESVTALAMYFSLTNFGLGMGLMNKLTGSLVRDDREEARRYVSSLAFALLAISVLGVVLISLLVPFVDWAHLLGSDAARGSSALQWAVWLATAGVVIAQPLSITYVIYSSYQETHIANLWEGIARIVTISSCVAVVWWTQWGLVGAVFASLSVPIVLRVTNSITMMIWEKPWLRPSIRHFDSSLLKGTLSQGAQFCVLDAATMLLFQTDKLVIAYFLGAEYVTGYAVLGRVFSTIAYGIYIIFLIPFWPSATEAMRRGDHEWVLRALRMFTRTGLAVMLGMGVALLIFGDAAFRLLSRITDQPQLAVSNNLILAVTMTFATRAWIDCRSVVLNAAGMLKPQVKIYVTHAVLNLVAAVVVAPVWGVEGVAWCIPATGLVTSTIGYSVLIRRIGAAPTSRSSN